MAVCTFTNETALLFIDRLLYALRNNRRKTRLELEKELFASKSKVLNYTRFLHGDTGATKRIYICAYEKSDTGGRTPIWAIGDLPDAIPPKPITEAQRWAIRKASPKKMEERNRKLRAAAAIKRATRRPQGIFAALGI